MTSKRFQTSFSTLGCSDYSWPKILNFASENQFDGVEPRCVAGETLSPENFRQLLPAPETLKQQLLEHGLFMPMLGTSVKLLERSSGEIDDLIEFARFADTVGCPWLRIFDGGQTAMTPDAKQLEETAAFLQKWEDVRHQEGFTAQLAVETHDALVSGPVTEAVMKALPPFAILWDTHHTWRTGGESLAGYFTLVQSRVVHFHVKDSINRPSKRKPFTYVKPGLGEFPWSELEDLLAGKASSSYLSFEWERHWNPELPPISEVVDGFKKATSGWK